MVRRRGHRQIIAGYYDGPIAQIREWLASAKGVRGVNGLMFTTWQNRYDQIEEFIKILDDGKDTK